MSRTESDIEAVLVAQSTVTVDTDAVIARTKRGARARRHRRTATAVVASVVCVAAAIATPVVLAGRPDATGPAQAPSTNPGPTGIPACTAHALDLPEGIVPDEIGPSVTDMDPTGRYVVGNYKMLHDGARVVVAIRWEDGTPRALPVSGLEVYAAGVNSSGAVAGYVSNSQYNQSAWLYTDGLTTTMPLPEGYSSAAATAINERGDVLGVAYDRSGGHSVVVWSADGSRSPRVLDPPGAIAYDIADDGTVVGVLPASANGPEQPYAWDPEGVGRALPLPAGAETAMPVSVRGEWAAGEAREPLAADLEEAPAAYMAVRWNLRTNDVSIVGDERGYVASAVNSRGDVAIGLASNPGRARLVRDGGWAELPLLPPLANESGQSRTWVYALSDDGTKAVGAQATGTAEATTALRAVLWRC